jgi:hypothetical protein
MTNDQIEEEVRRIIETPIGEYQVSLRELWRSWDCDRKSSPLDLILLLSVRARNEIQKRTEIETTTRERQLEQERLAEERSM